MQKLVLILLVIFLSNATYCQKKKAVAKKSNAISLATSGNIAAEISKTNFYLCINKKDTINIKPANLDNMPMNCKITAFKSKNTAFQLLSWTEVVTTTLPKKVTVVTTSFSKVYDLTTKTEVFSNVQTNTNIKEIVQLGKSAATETQERNRNEGYTLSLLPTGELSLKSKTKEQKVSYDAVSKTFK